MLRSYAKAFSFAVETESIDPSRSSYKLIVEGLRGGHSGLDIIHGRGNAIKILGRTLNMLNEFDYRIANVEKQEIKYSS